MQWSYDDDKNRVHPCPVAVVNVRNPSQSRNANRDVKCLVDCGSDVTGIPIRLLKRLGVTFEVTEKAQDYSGSWRDQQFSFVHVALCGIDSGPIKVARLKKGPIGILGRDVLNQFVVTLNGPELVCEIE